MDKKKNTTNIIAAIILIITVAILMIGLVPDIYNWYMIGKEVTDIDINDGTWTKCYGSDEIDIYAKYELYRWHTEEIDLDDYNGTETVYHKRPSVLIYTVNKTDNYITLIAEIQDDKGNHIMDDEYLAYPNRSEYMDEPWLGGTNQIPKEYNEVNLNITVVDGGKDGFVSIKAYDGAQYEDSQIITTFKATVNKKEETFKINN